MVIYPWQQNQWNHIQAYFRGERFPHALLLTGPKNLGKLFFAQLLAKRLLCQKHLEFACGICASCQLVAAGTHPDLIQLEPLADGKIIKIEQVRELVGQLELTAAVPASSRDGGQQEGRRAKRSGPAILPSDSKQNLVLRSDYYQEGVHGGFLPGTPGQTAQQGSYQVVIIDPAEAMNKAAANALLKTLEEPLGRVVFLLLSHQLGMLPPTIASRCQKINFLIPAKKDSAAWLEEKLPIAEHQNLSLLLALADNIPLRALSLYEENALIMVDKIVDCFLQMSLGKMSALEMASLCVSANQEIVFNALWSVVMDLVRLKADNNMPLVNVHKREILSLATAQISRSRLFDFLDHLAAAKRQIEEKINLNSQLLYENLFIY